MSTYEVYAQVRESDFSLSLEALIQSGACNCLIARNRLTKLPAEDAIELWHFCTKKYPAATVVLEATSY